jgi:hypothetical protein
LNHDWLNLGLSLLYLLVWFFIGKLANFLLGTELEDRGYVLTNEVKAKNAVAAREEATRERGESIHRMEIVEAQADDRQDSFMPTASLFSSSRSSSNYFLHHWQEDLSLPVSYWIKAIILVGILTVILFAASLRLSTAIQAYASRSLRGSGPWSEFGVPPPIMWRKVELPVGRTRRE